MPETIQTLVSDFASRLESAIRTEVHERVQSLLGEVTLGRGNGRRKPGRPAGIKVKRAPSPGRQLQGQYMGLLRGLKGRDHARVKAAAKKDGVESAIKLALQFKAKKAS